MLDWLRKRIKRWLDGPEPPPSSIEVWSGGQVRRMAIGGAVGLKLQVYGGGGVQLISEREALNQKEFWRAWRYYNNNRITWEDGTSYVPPER